MITNIALFIPLLCLAGKSLIADRTEESQYTVKELCFVTLCFFVGTLAFVYGTGIIASGYHLIDDHEFYTFGNRFDDMGFWGTFWETLRLDMQRRYRFTYIFIRIIQIYLLADNFTAWHIMYGVLTAANFSLAYYYARYRHCSMLVSYIFSVAIFIGCWQTEVIWRLGPQENLGVFLLLLTLITMRKNYEKKSVIYRYLMIFMIFLLSGIKESYLLLLPSLPIVNLLWNYLDSGTFGMGEIKKWFRDNLAFILYVNCLFAVSIIVLLISIGGVGFGYAGIDTSFGIGEWISSIFSIVVGDFKIYELVSLVFVGFAAFSVIPLAKGVYKRRVMIYGGIALALYVINVGMQFLLHAKSGILARYMLPLSFIVSFFVFIGVSKFISQTKKYQKFYVVLVTLMGALLIFHVNDEVAAKYYAQDGANITAALDSVSELYSDGKNVLIDIGYEQDSASAVYLLYKHNISSVYNVNYTEHEEGRYYCNYAYITSQSTEPISLADADIVLRKRSNGGELSGIDDSGKYVMQEYGEYSLYNKK